VAARRLLLERASFRAADDPIVLASHAIDRKATESLLAGDREGFLARRKAALEREMQRFTERMAAWDSLDRPSVEFLLQEAGAGT
jgi:hypothetical protein